MGLIDYAVKYSTVRDRLCQAPDLTTRTDRPESFQGGG